MFGNNKNDVQDAVTEPSVNDLSPVMKSGVEREPMFLIDTTGSMTFPISDGSTTDRRSLMGEAMGRLVEKLEGQDSQAAAEHEAGEDAGGVMTITFAGGTAKCLDDLSSANWRAKWGAIQWGGGTVIMPGWNLLSETFLEEFGERPKLDRPAILALVFTDGEADDTDEFAATLAASGAGTYVVIALMGFGQEHDRALAAYQKVAETNKRVRVVTFTGETSPDVIADGLLSLLS